MPTIVKRWPIPTMNSRQLQFASIDFNVRGVLFPWIGEVSYDQNLDPGEARGTSPLPMGVTLGELKANASISVQRIYREQFLNRIEKGVPGFMDKFFPIAVQYKEIGWPQVETDSFIARITGTGHDYSAGNGVLMVKFPLYTPFIILNGHVPFQGMPVSPK